MKFYSQKLLRSFMFSELCEEAVLSMLMHNNAFENEGCQTTIYIHSFKIDL